MRRSNIEHISTDSDLEPTPENLICEVTTLPPIPDELLDYELDVIESYENTFPHSQYADSVASYAVPKALEEWCQQHFSFPIVVKYLIVKRRLTPHIDHGIVGYKYSYLLNAGGKDIRTQFWDNVKEPHNIIAEQICEEKKWYRLHISSVHGVDEPPQPRIFVTCKQARQQVDLSLGLEVMKEST